MIYIVISVYIYIFNKNSIKFSHIFLNLSCTMLKYLYKFLKSAFLIKKQTVFIDTVTICHALHFLQHILVD